jgi:NAD(P)-dependent dehydrogenase (short-subunit alcohol dehydrogenase family)
VRSRNWFSFRGKTVLVTGGSRGLGLVIARELVARGARVAICARTLSDLRTAEDELRSRGGDVISVVCDVTDPDQVAAMVDQVRDRLGPAEVLMNVAGIMSVGPLDAMTDDDFHRAMRSNCWSALHTARAVLPDLRRAGWGRIVNVASIGGKQAIPHMLPYVVSKFALVGLSNGLRAELARENILVTTACPAVMRTGSPRNAFFKGQHQKEYTWFKMGSALPLVSMSAETAARQILEACQAGDGEVLITNGFNLGIQLHRLFPGLTSDLAALVNRLLPEMGGIGQNVARGFESETPFTSSWVATLNDSAARRNNEMRPAVR